MEPKHRLSPLRREIAAVLVIKVCALALIWSLWFSHPAAVHPDAIVSAPAASADR